MGIGEAKVLVTTESLYRRKVEGIRTRLPKTRARLLVATTTGLRAYPTR